MNSKRNHNDIHSRITNSHLSLLSVFSIIWYCALPFTCHWMEMDLSYWRQFSSPHITPPAVLLILIIASSITALLFLISIFGRNISLRIKWLNFAFIFCIIPNLMYAYFGFMDYVYVLNNTDYVNVIPLIPIVLLLSFVLFISYLHIKKVYKKSSKTKKHGVNNNVAEDDENLPVKKSFKNYSRTKKYGIRTTVTEDAKNVHINLKFV